MEMIFFFVLWSLVPLASVNLMLFFVLLIGGLWVLKCSIDINMAQKAVEKEKDLEETK